MLLNAATKTTILIARGCNQGGRKRKRKRKCIRNSDSISDPDSNSKLTSAQNCLPGSLLFLTSDPTQRGEFFDYLLVLRALPFSLVLMLSLASRIKLAPFRQR